VTAPDAPVHYDVIREALMDALGNHPLGEFLNLEAKERMADRLLAQMPVASEAAFYMEGVKAEREQIAVSLRRAAEGRRAYERGDADAFESAAEVAENPLRIMGLIPSWMWTPEEQAALGGPMQRPAETP
jgi:hypothetical protein